MGFCQASLLRVSDGTCLLVAGDFWGTQEWAQGPTEHTRAPRLFSQFGGAQTQVSATLLVASMLTRRPVPWGSQVPQLVRYHRCNIFKWLEPLFQICWEAQGPLYANTSGGGFSGGLAFSSCPLGGLTFSHPHFPILGSTSLLSYPGTTHTRLGGVTDFAGDFGCRRRDGLSSC